MRIVLATLAGLIASFAVNMGIVMIAVEVNPLLESGVDINDTEALINVMKNASWEDYLLPLAAHISGILAGLISARIICRTSLIPIYIVATVHMFGTVTNLYQIPHPTWFAIVDTGIPLLIIWRFIRKGNNR